MFDADMVDIGVKVFTHLFAEDLSEIRAVVTKQRCNIFQCVIACIIVVDVM